MSKTRRIIFVSPVVNKKPLYHTLEVNQ